MSGPWGWYAVGVAAAVWLGIVAAAFVVSPRSNGNWWSVSFAVAAAAALAAGAVGLRSHSVIELALPALGLAPFQLRLDSLSGWFLIIIGLAGLPTTLYLRSYMDHLRESVDMRLFWAAQALLFLSMAMV